MAVWFDRFPSYRNYRWGDSSSFLGPNIASEAISECILLKNFSWGSMSPGPTLFTLQRTQWPYHCKIAGRLKFTPFETVTSYLNVCHTLCVLRRMAVMTQNDFSKSQD